VSRIGARPMKPLAREKTCNARTGHPKRGLNGRRSKSSGRDVLLLLGSARFQQTYRVDTPTVLGVVLAVGAVSLAVTALSAHCATRPSPLLDMLRYV
jgi:hypothetical protein